MKSALVDFESEAELVSFAAASADNLMLALSWCGAVETAWDQSVGDFAFRATPLMLEVGPDGLVPLILKTWKEAKGR